MQNKNLLNRLIFLAFFTIVVAGCSQEMEKTSSTEKIEEEFTDTGALVIESSPSAAKVYFDGELKGDTPFTLYNIPVGLHDIAVKKDGYADFEEKITIKVGKTEEIDILLKPVKDAIEEKKPKEEVLIKDTPDSMPKLNIINLSNFAMYFDFDNKLFTDLRTEKSDIFSRRYDAHIDFTALAPAKIKIINKQLKDVKKEECISADDAIASFYSGQTLCVKTVEGSIIALSGSWEKAPSEVEWVLLS